MKFKIVALAVLTGLSGCAAGPEADVSGALSQRDPADPERETAAAPYRSVVAGYHPRTVVEPKPWTDTATDPQNGEASQ